ncbi:MAG: EAL domain-containing protein [Lachnospirales bacterium]
MFKRILAFILILIYTTLSLNIDVFAVTTESYVSDLEYIFDVEKLKEIYSVELSKLQLSIEDLGLTEEETKFLEKIRKEKYYYINIQNNDIGYINDKNYTLEALIIDEVNRVLKTNIEMINTYDVGLESIEEVNTVIKQNDNFFSSIYTYQDIKNNPFDYLKTDIYSNKDFFVISHNMQYIEDFDELLAEDITSKRIALSTYIEDTTKTYGKEIERYLILTPEKAREALLNKEIDYFICGSGAAVEVLKESNLQFKLFSSDYVTIDNSVHMFYANKNNELFIQIMNKVIKLLDKSVLRSYFYTYRYYQISEIFKRSLTEEEKAVLSSLSDLNVGVLDLKSLSEIKGKKVYGYTADVLSLLSGLLEINFNYVDISNENYVELFSENKINILPYVLDIQADELYYDFKRIDVEVGVTDYYINRKFEILKHIDTADLTNINRLNYVDIGTIDDIKDPISYFLEDINNSDKKNDINIYEDFDALVKGLNDGEIKYAIVPPGTSAYYEREFSLEQKIVLAYDVSDNIRDENYKWRMIVNLQSNTETLVNVLDKAIQVIDANHLSSNWFDYSLNYESYKDLKKSSETTTITILVAGFIGIVVIVILVTRNIASTKRMRLIASLDNLTNLFNKDVLFENMKDKSNFYVILINIRNFKKLNDIYGIIIADEILTTIADILRNIEATNLNNVVPYRLEKDEFLLCVNNLSNFKEEEFLTELYETLSQSLNIKNLILNLEYSISAVDSRYADNDFRQILVYANNMLIKNRSINKPFFIYDEAEKISIAEFLDIEKSLYNVTERNVLPYFQPFVDVKTGKVKGCEVLARLNLNNQVYLPYKFIPIAEKNGLLDDIDRLMLRRTLAIREQLLRDGVIDEEFYFSLNISAQFLKELSIEYLDNILVEFKLKDYSFLQMEVLEESLTDEEAKKIFEIVTAKNIRSAIDDFSTGYSSLLRLIQHFKFKVLKIDKSLLPIKFTERDKNVYKAIVDVIKKLDMSIVCEGVETEEHAKFLSTIDVDIFQGYYFSRPIPLDEFIEYIVIANKLWAKKEE